MVVVGRTLGNSVLEMASCSKSRGGWMGTSSVPESNVVVAVVDDDDGSVTDDDAVVVAGLGVVRRCSRCCCCCCCCGCPGGIPTWDGYGNRGAKGNRQWSGKGIPLVVVVA